MYAMNLARFQKFPDIKRTGTAGLPVMCVLTSEKVGPSVDRFSLYSRPTEDESKTTMTMRVR